MRIDFVSDIACPWCVIGLRGLEEALARASDVVEARIHFQPFELNPDAPPGGWSQAERFAQKYGWSREQVAQAQANVRDRAAAIGFTMRFSDESRTYNTFDAHRLLCWAEQKGRQTALKHALFRAYFTDALDVSDQEVLAGIAADAGLEEDEARAVLASGDYAIEVRSAERSWQSRGISGVPATIIDGTYLISGGQPVDAFEQAIREFAAQPAASITSG
jgi:predicted DsbA family dithiol-disulfide isomerase